MNNYIFDWKRFLMMLRINFKINRKLYITEASITLAFAILSEIIIYVSNSTPVSGESYCVPPFNGVFLFMMIMAMLLTNIMASQSFAGFSTSKQRINELMIPATHLEKYLSYVLPVTVGYYIFLVMCIAVVHLLREAIFPMQNIVRFNEVLAPICCGIMGLSIKSNQAIYVLGSTIWHKHSFWFTLLAINIITILIIICAGLQTIVLIKEYSFNLKFVSIYSGIVAIFCFVLSYFRFKEMEVISRF